MTINPNRPVEELIGDNYGIVRLRLGNLHVGHSLLQAAREARPTHMRYVPVALRRGWAQCVIETWAEYQDTYNHVMGGAV